MCISRGGVSRATFRQLSYKVTPGQAQQVKVVAGLLHGQICYLVRPVMSCVLRLQEQTILQRLQAPGLSLPFLVVWVWWVISIYSQPTPWVTTSTLMMALHLITGNSDGVGLVMVRLLVLLRLHAIQTTHMQQPHQEHNRVLNQAARSSMGMSLIRIVQVTSRRMHMDME